MMRMKRLAAVLIGILVCDSYAFAAPSFPSFSSLVVHGDVDLDIQSVRGAPTVQILSKGPELAHLEVRDNVLLISRDLPEPKGCPPMQGRPLIRLQMKCLHHINFHGSGNVRLLGFTQGSDLRITHHGCGMFRVNGNYDLRELHFHGNGCSVLTGIQSRHLDVIARGKGKAFLFGKATSLYADVANKVYLDAKKLQTEHAYVNATHIARVDVVAKKELHAFARKFSDIRYYQVPEFLGEHSSENGAVLNMVGLSPVCNPRTPMFAYSGRWQGDH